MWTLPFDSITGLAGASVLCTTFSWYLFTGQSELHSETLSWALLPILFKFLKRPDDNSNAPFSNSESQVASSISLWIMAVCISVASFCKAEHGILETFPALTPLLYLVQTRFHSDSTTSRTSNSWVFSPLVNTIWGTALVALFGVYTLSIGDAQGFAISCLAVAALLLIYVALLPRNSSISPLIPQINDIEDNAFSLSWRTVTTLLLAQVVQTAAFGFTRSTLPITLLLGMAKALSWYFIVQTTKHASWTIATVMATFGIMSTRNPFAQTSEFQAISHVLASFLALGQTIHMLPKQVKAVSSLWALFLVSLLPYIVNVLTIRSAQYSAQLSFRGNIKHPVSVLFENAKTDFESMLERQSKNYTAAQDEYRRRYSMDPPDGFQAWYEFAASHQSPIIDDFDSIHDSVSPFWRMSGSEVVQIMHNVQFASNSDVWMCEYASDTGNTRCSHPFRTNDRHFGLLFNNLLRDLRPALPNVKWLVNHLDEPRVLVPRSPEGQYTTNNGVFKQINLSHQTTWDALTKYCSSQQNSQDGLANRTTESTVLPFVKNLSSSIDLCHHPEYSGMHGLVLSPTSFRLIEGLVPILSSGAPSTMGDILFPCPSYIETEYLYDDGSDLHWDAKRNELYWAGSTSGGFALNDQWRNYHRQRFVELAQNLGHQQHHYLRERDGVVKSVASSFLNSRLFDVAFTRIYQCDKQYCRDQLAYFNTKAWAHKDRALQSRLVFDMDGNGMSGRYYKLLASRSVPLKQTILREWHDDRHIPWIHFIPVSLGMEELPELVSYLTSTTAGQRTAKEIAEEGRDWFTKAFREVDMSIYVYRLMLEIARLQDPNRRAN